MPVLWESILKFSNFILENLNESLHQKDAIKRIAFQIEELTEHTMKCLLMPSSRDYKHWSKEIRNYLRIIFFAANHTKTKRGNLSKEVIMKEFKDSPSDKLIKVCLSNINFEYEKNFLYTDSLINSVKKFFDKLWNDLGDLNFDIDSMFEYIDIIRSKNT